jgi:predicted signal transduction protein with EAL and GGDEF domain
MKTSRPGSVSYEVGCCERTFSERVFLGFVRDIATQPRALALAEAIVAMCKMLELGAEAEGVETLEQRDALVRMGIDEVQGYLLGRPCPIDELLTSAAPVGARAGAIDAPRGSR